MLCNTLLLLLAYMKLRKSGFISWRSIRIIVGHLDGSLFNNLGLGTRLALSSLLDAKRGSFSSARSGLSTGGNRLYLPAALRCT